MTPETLRYLREQRGLTREELAEFLGDCSASTVNKWERNMHAIPQWVEDKMLRHIPIQLPYQELHELLDEASTSGRSASAIIAEALRLWLTAQNEAKFTGSNANADTNTACASSAPSIATSHISPSTDNACEHCEAAAAARGGHPPARHRSGDCKPHASAGETQGSPLRKKAPPQQIR